VLLISICYLILHECGHALAMQYVKAPVLSAGFQFFLGLPVMYVDTSPAWIKPRKARIITALGGVIVNFTLAAIMVILSRVVTNEVLVTFFNLSVYINLFQATLALIPFVRMDGYYILVDLLDIPELDRKALDFFLDTIRRKQRKVPAWKKRFYLFFALMSILTTAWFIYYAYLFWLNLSLALAA
jgi:putative peptide zinc metalloprotease protein